MYGHQQCINLKCNYQVLYLEKGGGRKNLFEWQIFRNGCECFIQILGG